MSHIHSFIRNAGTSELRRLVALTAVSGLANAAMLVVVNNVAGAVAGEQKLGVGLYLAYALAFPLFFLTSRQALVRSNALIEGLLRDLRIRLADKLRCGDLLTVQGQARARFYTTVAQETNRLSMLFPILVNLMGQLVALMACLLYVGYLSAGALVLVLVVASGGVFAVSRVAGKSQQDQYAVVTDQEHLADALGHLVDGFKELSLNAAKRQAVLDNFGRLSQRCVQSQTRVADFTVEFNLVSALLLFGVLGVIGFVFPQYMTDHSVVVFKLTAAVLFCVGPVLSIMGFFPMAIQTEVGLGTIAQLERQIEEGFSASPDQSRAQTPSFLGFAKIAYHGVSFSHRDSQGETLFTAGPLDFTLHPGEVVYLVGGSGSGKTTSVRLMTGLFPAETGFVKVDDLAVTQASLAGFRELFSTVLTDFHLFDRLYGLEPVDQARVDELIAMTELGGKVSYRDGKFSNMSLSTGQRKRLALIIALLEDRPVYVFDEWAADQDVHFREKFYKEILPDLAKRGKAVLVVSHDDRYWPLADRVVKLDLGQVDWQESGQSLLA